MSFFPQHPAVGLARDLGQDDGLVVVTRGALHLLCRKRGFQPAPLSHGLVACEGGLDHEEVEDVSQRLRKELEELGREKIFSASFARLQLGESVRTCVREGTSAGTRETLAKWRAEWVASEMMWWRCGTGVPFLAVGDPFGGDVVLGGRPRAVGDHELGARSWGSLTEFANEEVRLGTIVVRRGKGCRLVVPA